MEGLDGLRQLIHWIITPPIETVGTLPVEMALKQASREKLARDINTQLVGAETAWHQGATFDLDELLTPSNSRTPIVVLNLSHLHEFSDLSFVVAQVCYHIYRWMRSKGGSSKPRLLFFIDEIGGAGGATAFYPTYPYNPPSKGPISLLVKQGRSFGVCSLLATQNSLDVDHRGLANCSTWAVGNLGSDRERQRIQRALEDHFSVSGDIVARMSSLQPRHFLLRSRDGSLHDFRERWLYTAHQSFSPTQLPQVLDVLDRISSAEEYSSEAPRSFRSTDGSRPQDVAAVAAADPAVQSSPSPSPVPAVPADSPSSAHRASDDRRYEAPLGLDDGEDDDEDDTLTVARTAEEDETATRRDSGAPWEAFDPDSGTVWPLETRRTYSVGRQSHCDIVLKDPTVSRRHLLLEIGEEAIVIRVDEGVKNELICDGESVPRGSIQRVDGDSCELVVGDKVLGLRRP